MEPVSLVVGFSIAGLFKWIYERGRKAGKTEQLALPAPRVALLAPEVVTDTNGARIAIVPPGASVVKVRQLPASTGGELWDGQ